MSEKLDLILSELQKMNARIERLESNENEIIKMTLSINERLDQHEKKLDTIMEQTARNAELESTVEELSSAVKANTTDIKLMKRILTNQ